MSCHTSFRRAIAASLGAALLVSFPLIALSQTQCPTSGSCFGCVGDLHCVQSLEPVFPPGGGPCPCYNLPAGTVAVDLSPSCYGLIQALDDYQVFGPTPGQPLSFTVQLRVQGQISGSGAAVARIVDLASGAEVVQSFTSADSPVDRTLVLPLQHSAEEVFGLRFYLDGDGSLPPNGGSGHLEGRFEFGGLTGGTYVSSCQGYLQDIPIPTLQMTWGRLKARYR
jgi:hypothetical protein